MKTQRQYIEQNGIIFPIKKSEGSGYVVTIPNGNSVYMRTIEEIRDYIAREYATVVAGNEVYKIKVTDKFSSKEYVRIIDNSTLQYARDVLADMVRRAQLFAVEGAIYRMWCGRPYLVETAVY